MGLVGTVNSLLQCEPDRFVETEDSSRFVPIQTVT